MTAVLAMLFVLFLVALMTTTALQEYSRSKLERLCAGKNPYLFGKILEHDEPALSALRAAIWLLVAVMALFFWWIAPTDVAVPQEWPVLALKSGAAFFALALGHLLIARPLGKLIAEPLLCHGWPLINLLRMLFFPLVWCEKSMLRGLNYVAGKADQPPASPFQEEILTVVNEGERDGSILGDAAEMIEGLIEMHAVAVSEVMTPRTDMIMLKSSATPAEARRAICEHGHSRLPVFGDTRDDIRGILYAKDLLSHQDVDPSAPKTLGDLHLRKPMFVAEHQRIDKLLHEFKRGHTHLAMVLDEYGGVAGLVTIEDILEEIVGDIADEFDRDDAAPVKRIDEHRIEVDGRLRVDELNELLPLALPEDADYDTVGGFVFSTLGRIPKAGESFDHGPAKFTILDANDRSIKRLRVEVAQNAEKANL